MNQSIIILGLDKVNLLILQRIKEIPPTCETKIKQLEYHKYRQFHQKILFHQEANKAIDNKMNYHLPIEAINQILIDRQEQ